MNSSTHSQSGAVCTAAASSDSNPEGSGVLAAQGLFFEQSLGQGIIAFSEEAHCRYLSPQAAVLLGLPSTEFLLGEAPNWIHPHDRAALNAFLVASAEFGEAREFEFRRCGGDEGYQWFSLLRLTPPGAGLPTGVTLYAFRDISERKAVERGLLRDEQTLSFLQDIGGIGAWVWDVVYDQVEWSPQVARLLALTGETPSYELVKRQVYPEDLLRWERTLEAAIAQQAPFAFDWRYCRTDGTVIWLHTESQVLFGADGDFYGFRGTVQDITERKDAEKAAACHREEMRVIYDNSPIMLCLLNPEHRILDANPAFAAFSAKSAEAVLGGWVCNVLGCTNALREPDAKLCEACSLCQGISAAFATETEQLNMAGAGILFRHGKTERVHLEGSATFLHRPEGPRVLLCLHDVTERRKSEERLEHYQNRLRSLAAELVQSEDRERRRIAIYLHDRIGQSLAGIRMQLGAFRNRPLKAADASCIADVEATISKVIEETRLLTFEVSPPLLYELGLGPALEWVGERLAEEQGLVFEFNDDGCIDGLDDGLRSALYRIGRELVINVIQHAHASRLRLSLQRVASSVRLSIEDDGVGMPAEWFEEHAVAAARHFGLFSIKEQIRRLGGQLSIGESELGGARVVICAPLSAGIGGG